MRLLQKRLCCLVKKSENTALGSAIGQAVRSYSEAGLLWNTVPAERVCLIHPRWRKYKLLQCVKKSIEAALHKNEGIQFQYPVKWNQISLPNKLLNFILMLKARAGRDAMKQTLSNELGGEQFGNINQKL